MKTYKDIWNYGKSFNYQINKRKPHGLWFDPKMAIGYHYQDNRKGFWLDSTN